MAIMTGQTSPIKERKMEAATERAASPHLQCGSTTVRLRGIALIALVTLEWIM
jgi:hypothetical protein